MCNLQIRPLAKIQGSQEYAFGVCEGRKKIVLLVCREVELLGHLLALHDKELLLVKAGPKTKPTWPSGGKRYVPVATADEALGWFEVLPNE